MISLDEINLIIDKYLSLRPLFAHNYTLLDIYEGNLKPYIEGDIKNTMSKESQDQLWDRIAPINVLTKIVDKMSTIYNVSPNRKILEGNETDVELLSWYEKQTQINSMMQDGTELYNLTKSHLIQPYAYKGKPQLRMIPNDRFFVLGTNKVDPMSPTHVVHFDELPNDVVIFYVYTETDFLVFQNDRKIRTDLMMQEAGNVEGINPYGALPFIYVNASRFRLIPTPDSDVLCMTKLLPLIMTDLNYAVKFQAFSILYGINVDDENLKLAPNAFWRFKSDKTTDKDAMIGSIKPQVDIDAVLSLIQSQLSLWLNTKGIRPGSVGKLEGDNFANGISKIIDEMDTLEYRQKLMDYYSQVEKDLWNLIMHHMNPYWVEKGDIDSNALFSPMAEVQVNFSLQLPAQTRADMVAELKEEMAAGFTSRRLALKKLNPTLSDEEIDALILDIDSERTVSSPEELPEDNVDETDPQDNEDDDAAA